MQSTNYDDHPFIAIWETTQACDLACQHCRASARPDRDRGELDTKEAFHLLDSLAAAGVPLVVLTGGDPAKRPDLTELVHHGAHQGLTMALTPSATPLVTPKLIDALARAGLSQLAISIDGPDAKRHDPFRGVAGSFDWSLQILQSARDAGLRTQINTTLHSHNIGDMASMVELVKRTGSVLWSVFHVVPTGRADVGMLPTAREVEASLEELARIAAREDFGVKTTAAPHYRRVLLERKKAGRSAPHPGTRGRASMRVNDGRGFLFISHRGEVFPSGFLPIACGNVRAKDPVEIYRTHPTFRALRDPEALNGKCSACEYRAICGGSRARAFALNGDMLSSDPLCPYVPSRWEGPVDVFSGEKQKRALPVFTY